MNSLDKNLRHLLSFYGCPKHMQEQAVEDIKKAFASPVSHDVEMLEDAPRVVMNMARSATGTYEAFAVEAIKKEAGLLTGQEWYEALKLRLNEYAWTPDEKDSILQAAYEASHHDALKLSKDRSWRFDTTGQHPEDNVMTGAEWCNRFEGELERELDTAMSLSVSLVKRTARKAAGMKK